MTTCKSCGSQITFKNMDGVFHPTNLDGSEHYDLCRTIRNDRVISLNNKFTDEQGNGFIDSDDKKLYMQMNSKPIRGKHYVETNCNCIPWEDCSNANHCQQ